MPQKSLNKIYKETKAIDKKARLSKIMKPLKQSSSGSANLDAKTKKMISKIPKFK